MVRRWRRQKNRPAEPWFSAAAKSHWLINALQSNGQGMLPLNGQLAQMQTGSSCSEPHDSPANEPHWTKSASVQLKNWSAGMPSYVYSQNSQHPQRIVDFIFCFTYCHPTVDCRPKVSDRKLWDFRVSCVGTPTFCLPCHYSAHSSFSWFDLFKGACHKLMRCRSHSFRFGRVRDEALRSATSEWLWTCCSCFPSSASRRYWMNNSKLSGLLSTAERNRSKDVAFHVRLFDIACQKAIWVMDAIRCDSKIGVNTSKIPELKYVRKQKQLPTWPHVSSAQTTIVCHILKISRSYSSIPKWMTKSYSERCNRFEPPKIEKEMLILQHCSIAHPTPHGPDKSPLKANLCREVKLSRTSQDSEAWQCMTYDKHRITGGQSKLHAPQTKPGPLLEALNVSPRILPVSKEQFTETLSPCTKRCEGASQCCKLVQIRCRRMCTIWLPCDRPNHNRQTCPKWHKFSTSHKSLKKICAPNIASAQCQWFTVIQHIDVGIPPKCTKGIHGRYPRKVCKSILLR